MIKKVKQILRPKREPQTADQLGSTSGDSMLASFQQFKQNYQLRRHGVHKFAAQYHLKIEMGPYVLKTAENADELLASFKLRDEVFNQEFRGLQKVGLDFDKFDFVFDHLIIVHKTQNAIVGTYRVRIADDFSHSYTALEFDLRPGLNRPGPFLELGRACIHKEHRRGVVLTLLWRGIAEYMNLSGAETLFGCSSVKINEPRTMALLHEYLRQSGYLDEQNLLKPRRAFQMKGFAGWQETFAEGLREDEKAEVESLLPALLKSYLKLGAKICGSPAFDHDFDCIDLLTVLRRQDLSASTERKFKVGAAPASPNEG